MTARLPIALLALALAFGCSKKKTHPTVDPEEQKAKLAQYILDQAPEIDNKLDIKFGDKVTLLGYNLDAPVPLKPGQKVKLTFYWQPTDKVEGGYKLFTQILDASGEKLINIDRWAPLRPSKKDKSGGLPVGAWEPGKVYVDQQSFHVPKAKTESIQVVTGLFSKEGRLPITAGPKDSSDRAIVASFALQPSEAQTKAKLTQFPSVSVDRLKKTDKITIDGKLDEAAWKTAPVLGPFVDVQTGAPPKDSPVNGSARVLWNDTNLYVAFEVAEANIVGGFPKNAKDPHLWTKDTVELIVDPDGDGDNEDYYEIQINPQNLVFDSQYDKYNEPKTEPDGPFGHEDWSSKLKSAVVVDGTIDKPEDTDKGYTVEAQIPWKSFSKAKKVPPALGDTWRMNLYAMKDNSGVAWSPILGQGNFHKASRFGQVRFTAKGWTPPTEPTTADGGAPAPTDSAAAPSASASGNTMLPAMPKAIGSSIKTPTARPLPAPH
jgi:Carbohydrate family 9 binding domain-like